MYGIGYSLFNSLTFLGARGGSVDPDALSFITAASITDPTQQSAVNQLVVDLKAANLWTKMKAVYPFVGGSASSHKWNLKDPRDLDAAFRLSFSGGWTHSANGADPNGTNAYADTFFNPSTWTNEHLSFYSGDNTATATGIDIGSVSSSSNRYLLSCGVSSTSSPLGAFVDPVVTSTDSASGFHLVTVNGFEVKLYKGSTNTDTDTRGAGTPISAGNVWIGAANSIGYYSNRQARFASIGTGLSGTDVSNLYTAVQAFQTALSRNV